MECNMLLSVLLFLVFSIGTAEKEMNPTVFSTGTAENEMNPTETNSFLTSINLMETTIHTEIREESTSSLILTEPVETTMQSTVDKESTSLQTPTKLMETTKPSEIHKESTSLQTPTKLMETTKPSEIHKGPSQNDKKDKLYSATNDHKTNDDSFSYDYDRVRRDGLICAAVLFVLGILIITTGRIHKGSRCRKRQRRTFEVTRL
ncbi:FXYD domain-containing ion transport regulator 5-like isoform X2 [Protopterus annectens]|uniref:FXYD domain-containing ion transport regulator 5-like isoform X2 n=1 Tax=Protopterus annectens TaxID=7888 RepID=UPI001CFC05DD|nr:FXYD domain-containing ion transport regulator 5-like isoform X2 [Protopterus annectens]